MSDFLCVLDELINDYVNTNPHSSLTHQFGKLYWAFDTYVHSKDNIISFTPLDMYNELSKRGINVVMINNDCCLLYHNNKMKKIRGFGDFTNYINSYFVRSYKKIHRKALSRFFRKGGAVMINNDIITNMKQLSKYLP